MHWFYYAFLLTSYRLGDLSQVYPVARGIAPVLVAIGGWLFAGEVLNSGSWGAILLVSFGISLLAANAYRQRASSAAIFAALATGATIATYSVVDGLGARISQNPLGYIGWLFLFEGLFAFYVFVRERAKLPALGARIYRLGLFGGLASSAAYGMVIFAKTLAPLGAISAVRESSVIVAALIGVVLFGERPWELRLVSATIVVAGILLLVWSS
ncbi:MAG: EamA family transporter [Hyphomicrobiales bacterium]|nr:EamA family transporter [Hyphomicrobiales bacterium]